MLAKLFWGFSVSEELEFKRWFRTKFAGWSETHEPRHGSAMGMPDLQLLVKGSLLPVELKVGWVKGGRLFVSALRPAQIGWHIRFMREGGVATIVVGIRKASNGWVALSPPWTVDSLMGWKKGWPIVDCPLWTWE